MLGSSVAIQEDTLLRARRRVEQAGTVFAFPPGTVHPGRDRGLGMERRQVAGKQVSERASEQTLPFPDFAGDYRPSITDTLNYPYEGSPDADRG